MVYKSCCFEYREITYVVDDMFKSYFNPNGKARIIYDKIRIKYYFDKILAVEVDEMLYLIKNEIYKKW